MTRVLRNPYVWAFVVGCVVVTSMRPLLRRVPEPPPVIGRVPPFSLVASDGAAYGSSALAGHPYLASFFCTRCDEASEQRLKSMAALAERYGDDRLDAIRLLSISVEPEHDTPERLRDEAKRRAADGRRWVLVTGTSAAIRALAEQGFGVAPGSLRALADAGGGAKLFLVDGLGRLRGRYEDGALGLDEAYWRARRVAEEERASRAG